MTDLWDYVCECGHSDCQRVFDKDVFIVASDFRNKLEEKDGQKTYFVLLMDCNYRSEFVEIGHGDGFLICKR